MSLPPPDHQARHRTGGWATPGDALDPRHHLRFLDHPVVQAYVSLRAFGDLTAPLDAVIAEIRSRTQPGARIFSPGCGIGIDEIAMAGALPDRNFVASDPSSRLLDLARGAAARDGVTNLQFTLAELDDPPLDPESCNIITSLRASHHVAELEVFWRRCHQALVPGGVVLAQEYIGPPGLQWSDQQAEHANRALQDLVPAQHQVHHTVVGSDTASQVEIECRGIAPRSDELIATCLDAGFEFTGSVRAGCGLLHATLLGQIETFDPTSWQDNLVLSRLFRAEAQLMDREALDSDFAMFIAAPR